MRVSDYMTEAPLTVTADMPIMAAVRLLVEHDISGAMVIEANMTPVGILTERDCIRIALQSGYFDEHIGIVGDYMTTDITSVSPEDSLMDVAQLFADSTYWRCPVVDQGRLVGIISRRNVLRALTEASWFGEPQSKS
jgi:CBS domain-containing protein